MTFPVDLLLKCWFLAGPTACGKTAASLFLAERIGAEIIALDSMTLYRGLNIGTAKPTSTERSRVPHHLIDLCDPDQEFSLAEYLDSATSACREVVARGRIPLFVGGAGLYLRGLLRGVFEGPAADWTLRSQLEELSQTDGPQALHDRLRQVDALTANRLHPNDQRRVIRALEVFEMTGQPLSVLQQHGPRSIDQRPRHVYWLSPPRDWLYRRIDQRVVQMLAEGLVDEVRGLLDGPRSLGHTASQALGYKEVIDWLEASQHRHEPPELAVPVALNELAQTIQTRTRQFAKRQLTWFRNLEECVPVTIDDGDSPDAIAARIVLMSGERMSG